MKRLRFAVHTLNIISCVTCGNAQEIAPGRDSAATVLPTVIVAARRVPSDPVTEASSSTVLERADLSMSEERELNGVLRGLPGVTLQKAGSGSTLSTLFLRGASSGLGQWMLDGIPMFSSSTGAFNLSTIPADALERVEVVRGPSAPRYGSQALGGVIRLFTRDGLDDRASLHVEGGSYGTLSETAGGSMVGDRARLTATASRDDIFEGTSEADPDNGNGERDNYQSTQGVLRVAAAPLASLDLDGSLFYNRYRAEIDGPGFLPSGQVGFMDDLRGLVHEETWMAQTTATAHLASSWDSKLQLGFTRNRSSGRATPGVFGFDNRLLLANWTNRHTFFEFPSFPPSPSSGHLLPEGEGNKERPSAAGSRVRSTSSNAREKGNLRGGRRLQLSWGGEARYENGENQFDLPGLRLQGERGIYAGFAEVQGELGQWGGFVGGRVDHYEDFGTHPTVRFGTSWQATRELKLRGSGGYGYRAPSFHERFFIPLFGNPTLKPEKGWSGDFGFDWTPTDAARLSIAGFYSRYDDLIQLSFTPDRLGLFISENVPNARIQGVEIEGIYNWNDSISTGFEYTFTDSENLDTHRVLPRRPEHQGRVHGEWRLAAVPLTLWAEVVYRGRHFDDSANTLGVGDAVYLNVQASYRLAPQLSFYVRGENLADDRTPEIFSFGARGAAVYAGVRADLY